MAWTYYANFMNCHMLLGIYIYLFGPPKGDVLQLPRYGTANFVVVRYCTARSRTFVKRSILNISKIATKILYT